MVVRIQTRIGKARNTNGTWYASDPRFQDELRAFESQRVERGHDPHIEVAAAQAYIEAYGGRITEIDIEPEARFPKGATP